MGELSAIIGMLSAMDWNHCPQSIGIPVRNRRNPQTTASNEISTSILPAPNPEVAMLEVGTFVEHGAPYGAVVGRQEDVRLVIEIDADVDKVPFSEEARNEVPD